jgi:hypothetical protein
MIQTLKVFISSTSEDLKDYRVVVRNTISELGWVPRLMENFGPMAKHTVAACQEEVQACDLVVLLVAFRYGYVPSKEQGGNGVDSITALELQSARQHHKDVLIFLSDPKKPWPPDFVDRDRTLIDNFRQSLDQPAGLFGYEDPTQDSDVILPLFRANVFGALVNYEKNRLVPDSSLSASGTGGLENFPGASKRLLSGKCIPFLGPGVHGNGPLSICALRKALGDESCQSCDTSSCQTSSLATAAEYQKTSPNRDLFLVDLKHIILQQTQAAAPPPVYDLIRQIKPLIIVNATLDLLLETKLWDNGKQRCLILCHAIRSNEGGQAGKILIFQGPEDSSPKLCPATDTIDLDAEKKQRPEDRAYIVYKPLGSPLLSSLSGLDTVVITEADYSILLQRLGSQETGVPTAFTTCFKNNPPIFLGYPMDFWHFRLMGQVFKAIPTNDDCKPFFAVHKAELPMEEKAWKGLGVMFVSMDLGEFSQKVKAASSQSGVTP